ncbi:MAG: type IV secretory system conjugative DNA transfer family protein [Lachnospiraceae bacterium]|nr:type IV secretory system conjugative DNA transfer family protein [Lachnospiraceae bacterium]
MADKVILAENCIYSSDTEKTQLNNNIIVCGTSGCGKTMSVAEPRLLETFETSLVVTLTKRRLINKYMNVFRKRGYNVWDLNFANPKKSQVSYDPLKYINSHQDIIFLSKALIEADVDPDTVRKDPFWDDTAASLMSGIIAYCMMKKKNATMGDVVRMFKRINFQIDANGYTTDLDEEFETLERKNPGCFAVTCWNTFRKMPEKTAACVYGSANKAIDKIFSPELVAMFDKEESVDFEKLAKEKTVLFVTSSAVNPSLSCFVNIFYAQVFKSLFEFAELRDDGTLPVPVHVLCDDFATGSRICNFPEYISIFREKRISVTLLLQSESQLEAMYGSGNATTIINNCDTYLYFGSMDLHTSKNISIRLNEPVDEVLYMPIGDVYVFRRGQRPIKTKRYNILNDEKYIKVTEEYNNRQNDKGVKKYA